ncbi:hypothetical protein [Methanopyrus sp.]
MDKVRVTWVATLLVPPSESDRKLGLLERLSLHVRGLSGGKVVE